MKQHTIQISDHVYQLLVRQAVRLQTTPERVIERLLISDFTVSLSELESFAETSAVNNDTVEALAAVERLTTLFAHVNFSGLDEVLNDPMLALANIDMGASWL
ncbi:MAG: hypothetical protein U0350_46770 [Caldilineaceae bacterium]